MPLAARMGDMEACPNGGDSPIVTGAATVFIEGRPAGRKGDKLACAGGHTQIETGSPTVFIEGREAARVTDTTCHRGAIATGASSVYIGNGSGTRVTTLGRAHQAGTPFIRG